MCFISYFMWNDIHLVMLVERLFISNEEFSLLLGDM